MMARGGKGGFRGGSRGKGAGFAQSGGKSSTFGGGKGGGTQASKGAASKRKTQGTGGNIPPNRYTIVSATGDSAATGLSGTSVKTGPLPGFSRGRKPVATRYVPPVRGGHVP